MRLIVEPLGKTVQLSYGLVELPALDRATANKLGHPDVVPAHYHLHSHNRDDKGQEGGNTGDAPHRREFDQRRDNHGGAEAAAAEIIQDVTDADLFVSRCKLVELGKNLLDVFGFLVHLRFLSRR